MIATDRGLVLRVYKLRETSKIVSFLGLDHGRIRLVAHGGRGPTHPFGASLEPGNEIDLVFSTGARDLGTLREAMLRHAWVARARRLDAVGAGLAVVELLDQVVPEGAQDRALVLDGLAALAQTAASPDRAAALQAFLGFELALLSRLGLQPAVQACARCGRPAGETAAWIDLRAGVVVCAGCGGRAANWIALAPEAARLLAALAAGGRPGASAPSARRTVGLVLHRLLGMHLEGYKYPRSLALLKKVDSPLSPAPGDPGFSSGSGAAEASS